MISSDFFSSQLNPAQFDAVETLDGPLLILAGAGSGKTRVLTYRIANLVAQKRAKPDEILAVTFTNKAAKSMEHRTSELLQKMGVPVYGRLWISTFHSTCTRILREHISNLGYQRAFVIYDDGDQISMIKKACEILNLNDKVYPPKTFQHRINEAKQTGVSPQAMKKRVGNFLEEKAALVYEIYEREMKKNNALDFGDLLLKTFELFDQHPEVLSFYQEKFKYILVDEYQDTNNIQYRLLQLLAKKYKNLCVVGDEDQSIYSWRGADITNILNFERDFANAKVIKLEHNYRSTKTIVEAASEVIKNNTQRKEKTLYTENDVGELITVQEEQNEHDEARFVVRTIETIMGPGDNNFKDIAIFYRTNAQSRVLEDQLRSHQIPYRLIGSVKFYDRLEIKDTIGYLKLLLNPRDDLSFKRVINRPPRRIGKTTLDRLEEISIEKNISLIEASHWAVQNQDVHSGAVKGISSFLALMVRLKEYTQNVKPSEALQFILDETSYIEMLKNERTAEAESRIENLQEFYNAITEFEKERGEEGTLQNFIEEIALVSDLDNMTENENTVTLMTLHLSKGLEFPFGFIVGLEESLFPSRQASTSFDPTLVEEERRLCYVGMTRAMKKLYLTHARRRQLWGMEQMNPPSRFLSEIPEKYIEKQSALKMPKFFQRYGKPRLVTDDFVQETPDYSETSFAQESFDETGDEGFAKGSKVRHPTFGIGTIYKSEGRGEGQKVTVLFQNNTMKTFAVKYARLERV